VNPYAFAVPLSGVGMYFNILHKDRGKSTVFRRDLKQTVIVSDFGRHDVINNARPPIGGLALL
jgi:hypothetical protein